jgi:CCR4-NOT transcription complex subunit 1
LTPLLLSSVSLRTSPLIRIQKVRFGLSPLCPLNRQLLTALLSLPLPGQYLLISSIANHLRYPSAHTYFFSHLLIHLFNSALPPTPSSDGKQQQTDSKLPEIIARVLLERVVVSRPHPWGTLLSFVTMLRQRDFWSHEFAQSSPELKELFVRCSSI